MPGSLYFLRIDVNFQTAFVTSFHYRFFFISINIKVLQILHIKFKPNILIRSGENDDFISFAVFSNCGMS